MRSTHPHEEEEEEEEEGLFKADAVNGRRPGRPRRESNVHRAKTTRFEVLRGASAVSPVMVPHVARPLWAQRVYHLSALLLYSSLRVALSDMVDMQPLSRRSLWSAPLPLGKWAVER